MTTAELESVLTAGNAAAHLTPERWAAANRHLVRKAIAEFSHERILIPERISAGEPAGAGTESGARANEYRVLSDDASVEYRFSARVLHLDHWSVDAASISCSRDGEDAPLDALRFITEFHDVLGVRQEMLPVYLEEISSTLSSHAYKQWMGQPSSAELAAGVTRGADVATDFQTIERSMTEGHPCFVANNGRLGFGISDYRAFAPETGAAVQLEWIAVHRSQGRLHLQRRTGLRRPSWRRTGRRRAGLLRR